MPSAVLTPTDGTAIELIGGSAVAPYELAYEESRDNLFPVPEYEESYAAGTLTEGGPRVRSQPGNKTGTGKLFVRGTNPANLGVSVAAFEATIEACRRRGGTLDYTNEMGNTITYEVLSAFLTAFPQDTPLFRGTAQAEVSFSLVYAPFGLLPQETVVTNANGSGPLVEFEVPPLAGSVDALGILTVQDTAGQARKWLEGGLESRYYDSSAPASLIVDSDTMLPLGSTQSTRTGAYDPDATGNNVLRNAAVGTSTSGLAYFVTNHVGRFRIKARVYTPNATPAYVVCGYQVGQGSGPWNQWVRIPGTAAFYELDLGMLDAPPIPFGQQSISWNISAKADATTTVDLDYVKFIPAERYFRASGGVGFADTIRANRYAKVRWDSVLTEVNTNVWAHHGTSAGSYLRIPPEGGRMAVYANRADLGSQAMAVLGDATRYDLEVIPRVALLGA